MVGVADKKGKKVRGKKGAKTKAQLLPIKSYAFAYQYLCFCKAKAMLLQKGRYPAFPYYIKKEIVFL